MAKSVTIFEVGPRDGLQNEKTLIDLAAVSNFARQITRSSHDL